MYAPDFTQPCLSNLAPASERVFQSDVDSRSCRRYRARRLRFQREDERQLGEKILQVLIFPEHLRIGQLLFRKRGAQRCQPFGESVGVEVLSADDRQRSPSITLILAEGE